MVCWFVPCATVDIDLNRFCRVVVPKTYPDKITSTVKEPPRSWHCEGPRISDFCRRIWVHCWAPGWVVTGAHLREVKWCWIACDGYHFLVRFFFNVNLIGVDISGIKSAC